MSSVLGGDGQAKATQSAATTDWGEGMSEMCGLHQPGPDLPDAGGGMCCIGAAVYGPARCTCWEPVYDLDQTEPDLSAPQGVQPAMCADCAYRPGSPERTGSEDVKGNQDELDRLVASGDIFTCHQGIRRPQLWRHPTGAEIPGSPANYMPPIVNGAPYRADGTPALVCAGWAARRLRLSPRNPA